MSINKLVNIKIPVMNAMSNLGLDHDKDRPIFTTWAEQAEEEIGSKGAMERKRVVLDIHGCAACLPNDARILECALIGDYGCDCGDLMDGCFNSTSGTFFVNQSNPNLSGFLIVDVVSSGEFGWGYVNYTIQDNKIIFSSNYDGQKVTVQYQGAVTDCDGFIEIGENHVRAIEAFITWKYYQRKCAKSPSGGNMNMMRDWERQWNQLCSHARGDDAILTQSERNEIASMNTDPYAGRGLAVGMRTTLSLGNNYFPY